MNILRSIYIYISATLFLLHGFLRMSILLLHHKHVLICQHMLLSPICSHVIDSIVSVSEDLRNIHVYNLPVGWRFIMPSIHRPSSFHH